MVDTDQFITILHGGSSETPKLYYVIYEQPLMRKPAYMLDSQCTMHHCALCNVHCTYMRESNICSYSTSRVKISFIMMMMITEAAGEDGGVDARLLEGFPGIDERE